MVIKDPLIPLKLQFFEGIASELNSFLITFQSDKPMIPFLVEKLEELLRLLCVKFIRKDTLDAACTTYALLKVDVTDTSNQKIVSDVDVGFTIKHDIKILPSSKKGTDTNLQFQRRSNAVPCNSLQPHHEKTLINSLCARCLFCLLPNHLADFPEKYEKLFTKILERLVLYKRISGKEADTAKQEYSSFLRIVMKIG